MFAIIETGGKQYKIEKGSILEVEKMEAKEGETITIHNVLLISDKENLKLGNPVIQGAAVTAKVVSHVKADKIKVFKMKAKEHYQRTQGHRQKLTTLEIINIQESGATPKAKAVKEETTEKAAAPKKAPAKKTKAVEA